jgi:hypothetical protein
LDGAELIGSDFTTKPALPSSKNCYVICLI